MAWESTTQETTTRTRQLLPRSSPFTKIPFTTQQPVYQKPVDQAAIRLPKTVATRLATQNHTRHRQHYQQHSDDPHTTYHLPNTSNITTMPTPSATPAILVLGGTGTVGSHIVRARTSSPLAHPL